MIYACAGGCAGAREISRTLVPGQWSSTFDKRSGYTAAVFQFSHGARLSLACDSAGARPGRGHIAFAFPAPMTATPVPSSADLVITAAGRTLSLPVLIHTDDSAPASPSRRSAKTAAPSVPLLTAMFALDGSDKNAAIMADLVTLLRGEKKSAALRLSAFDLELAVGLTNLHRAISGYETGCLNYLPPEDEEVIWDWHQGLDRIDDKRSITLVAQSAPLQGKTDIMRLSLHCYADRLRISLSGSSDMIPDMKALAITGEKTNASAIIARAGDTRGDIEIAPESFASVLALLKTEEKITVSVSQEAGKTILVPVAGFRLASRLMAHHCPVINH